MPTLALPTRTPTVLATERVLRAIPSAWPGRLAKLALAFLPVLGAAGVVGAARQRPVAIAPAPSPATVAQEDEPPVAPPASKVIVRSGLIKIAGSPRQHAAPIAPAPTGPRALGPAKVKAVVLTPAPAPVELPVPPVAPTPTENPTGEGTLVVETNPPCMVAVDGAWQGPTPVRLKLRAGKHVVFLSNPSLQVRKAVPITLGTDQVIEKRFDFSHPDE